MSADIQIIGDEILFDGQKVARFHGNLNPSLRFGFVEMLSEIQTEQEIADKINFAESEAEAGAKSSVIADIREAMNDIDFRDENCEARLNKTLDELEPK